jgi:ABC-type polysaccharide/polyol phosphate transport system ATPase subunit
MNIHSKNTSVKNSDLPVISLEEIGVSYRAPKERVQSFKEFIIRWLQRKVQYQYFWALQNVNLSIRKGETFGLIGHNGAGKSTLLKLVARVLRPTKGRLIVRGQISPLLGYGAGFHGELTGRENVYLNGALLGFTRQEMSEKFERIVDFAELWDFIDAPIRTYSSGMYARLGFAVATDVNPDVLLIDEVLSVGDSAFKKKSEARLLEFRDRGATILFVSHSMPAITRMCQRAAWLDHGQIKAIGETEEVVEAYLGG